VDTPDDFIETEINRILEILEKHCEVFAVDKKTTKVRSTTKEVTVAEESEQKHVNR
jgi:hypothetical protein